MFGVVTDVVAYILLIGYWCLWIRILADEVIALVSLIAVTCIGIYLIFELHCQWFLLYNQLK